ncbi:MAG: prepilin-type N-terminal cleavage/methylation domain-containing protein [Bacilli bacterium]|nr:prepilin-type N-terminal cleavage/methylation domain-containing protein [Bacilli bacterium]
MNYNKSAFTLIELLAVIVLIGLLATLIISKLSPSIDKSKESTFYASSTSLIKSLENYYFEKKMKGNFNGCEYNFESNTNSCEGFSFTGKMPDGGRLTLNIDGNIDGNLIFDEYEYNIMNNVVIENNNVQTGTTYLFNNTKEFNAPYSGYYKLEVWGAQGGSYDNQYIGGYGGYSTGVVNLDKNQKIYIHVGSRGVVNRDIGDGLHNAGTGGDASYITFDNGELSTFSNNLDSILIVAGGGGSANYHKNGYYGSGGHAGGYIGGSGTATGASTRVAPTGGTQESGGLGTNAGTFGLGGINDGYSTGGNGFYGGGASNTALIDYGLAGTGGGSGYIGNALLTDKAMYCYNCIESAEPDTLTITTTNVSDEPISGYAKIGDGYAKITYLGKQT